MCIKVSVIQKVTQTNRLVRKKELIEEWNDVAINIGEEDTVN